MAKKKDPVKEAADTFLADVENVVPDDEGESPPEYDEKAVEEQGAAVEEGMAKSGALEANPEGMGEDDEKEARAQSPPPESRIEEAFAKKSAAPKGTYTPNIAEEFKPVTGQGQPIFDALGNPIRVPGQQLPSADFVLAADHGGRFRLWEFNDLRVVQGFAQQLPGKKRLFKRTGKQEMQEITAMGVPVARG